MSYLYQCVDGSEPVSDTFGEQVAATNQYGVFSGNAITYSASDMVVTVGDGTIVHNYTTLAVASDTVTLVADTSNPRWSWVARDSTGDLVLISGDPAAVPAVPELGDNVASALVYIQANQTIASNCAQKIDKRVPFTFATKYKSTTQTISASTSYADVTATSGTFSFYAEASTNYIAEYYIPMSFTSTGGSKFQITGPSSPTAVTISGDFSEGIGGNVSVDLQPIQAPFATVSAFSSDINSKAANSTNSATQVWTNNFSTGSYIRIRMFLRNGVNAGAVTLQTAQNSASGTAVLGIGSTMVVRRVG